MQGGDTATVIALMQATDYAGYVRLMEVMNRYHYEALPEVFQPGPVPMLTQHEYWQLVGRNDRRLIGAFVEEQLAGFVLVKRVKSEPHPLFRSKVSCHISKVIVDPGFRRRGLAQQLLAAAETWAKEQGSETVTLTVFEFNESARSLYETCGYDTQSRAMCKRLVSCDESTAGRIQIRAATLADAPGIGKVHVDVWNSTYAGIVPQAFLDSRTYAGQTSMWERIIGARHPKQHVYVAVDENDQILGFTSGGASRDKAYPFGGELYAIYLFKDRQGTGIGRQLFQATVARLAADGFTSMLLWVLEDNETRRFYERMGGTVRGEKVEEIGGKPLKELAYGWDSLRGMVQ